MNCIAIDDEPLALDVIKEFCSKIHFIHFLGSFNSGMDAISLINTGKVDLVFLDIQMPDITGLDFIRTLENPPRVIFTTAYSEHALQGFELNAIDYLIKPIPFDRFFKAVNRAYELYLLKRGNAEKGPSQEALPEKAALRHLMIKVEYRTVRIDLDTILFIEGLKDYIKIYTGGRPVLTKSTMKNIMDKLPAEEFIRVHKSFIVSLNKIESISNNRIEIGEKIIPIGEQFRLAFYEKINETKL